MASDKELQRHYKSVKTVGQVSGAMKAIATSKISKYGEKYEACKDYSRMLSGMLHKLPKSNKKELFVDDNAPGLYVIVQADRGLCGSYRADLDSFAKTVLEQETRACEKKVITTSDSFDIFEKEYSFVFFIYQSFINILNQKPVCTQVLPHRLEDSEDHAPDNVELLPNEESVREELTRLAVEAQVSLILLEAALSQQAATVVAMGSAYDNAKEAETNIGLAISRQRQAAITASVIEISQGAGFED